MEHKHSDCTIEITIVHSFKLVNDVLKITLLVKFVFPLAPIGLLTVTGNKMTSHSHAFQTLYANLLVVLHDYSLPGKKPAEIDGISLFWQTM